MYLADLQTRIAAVALAMLSTVSFASAQAQTKAATRVRTVSACRLLTTPQQFLHRKVRIAANIHSGVFTDDCEAELQAVDASYEEVTPRLRHNLPNTEAVRAFYALRSQSLPDPEPKPGVIRGHLTVSTPLYRYLGVTLLGRVYRVVEVFPEGHPVRTEERSFDSSPYVFLVDNVEQVSPGPKNIPVTY